MFRAIQVRPEHHAVIGNFSEISETEYLKAARVRKDRSRPRHETMQTTQLANSLMAGPKIQVICISEQDLHAQLAERLLRQPLHRALRADGHECRGINHAVRRRETPEARAGRIGFQDVKMKFHLYLPAGLR